MRFTFALLTLALLPFAGAAAPAPKTPPAPAAKTAPAPAAKTAPAPKTARVLVYEVKRSDGLRTTARLNGFNLEELVTSSNGDESLRDFPGIMAASVVHPFYVKADNNVVVGEVHLDESLVANDDKGPWWWHAELVSEEVGPDSRQTDAPPRPLASWQSEQFRRGNKTTAKTKEVRFAWQEPLPVWAWTRAPTLKNDDATRDSVYAALESFYKSLASLADPKWPAAERARFVEGVNRDNGDYVASCELLGKKDGNLDELFAAATTLGLPTDAQARAEAARPQRPRSDVVSDEPAQHGPEDYAMTHLRLMPLPAKNELRLELIGDGRIARLVPQSGAIIAYSSNWPDGGWGAVGDEKLKAEVWFSRADNGSWSIAAVVNTRRQNLSLLNEGMPGLLESSGLR